MAIKFEVAPEDTIYIRVEGRGHTNITFKMRKSNTLKKLMMVYCEKNGLVMEETRFRFEGEGISEHDTPSYLRMKDDDLISVYKAHI